MNKNFKSVKASLIIGIMLVSLFAAVVPSSSAAGLGLFRDLSAEMTFSYDESKTYNIIPADQTGSSIRLDIQYQIMGILAAFAEKRYDGVALANIQLSVGSFAGSEYTNAALSHQSIPVPVKKTFESLSITPYLHVTFLESAPFMAQVNIPIIIRATVAPAFPFSVETIERTFYVPASAAYIPIIDAIPTRNFLEVAPGDVAVFGIECENKGNAETEFRFEVTNIPDGWSVNIVSNVKVSPSSKKIVNLEVRSPYGFGYHDQQRDIEVKVQGFYYASSGQTTNSSVYNVRVTVRDRGFYVSALDAMIILIALFVLIVIAFIFMRWRKSK